MDLISFLIEFQNNLPSGFLGINIGPNKDTKKEEDYYFVYLDFQTTLDYLTINISSPNTEGLRDFHDEESLKTF